MPGLHSSHPSFTDSWPRSAAADAGLGAPFGGAVRQAFRLTTRALGLAGFLILAVLLEVRERGRSDLGWVPEESYNPAHLLLLEMLGPNRVVAGRLSGLRSYQPYQPTHASHPPTAPATSRGAGDSALRGDPAVSIPREISSALLRAEAQEPSPENLAAVAVMSLLAGQPSKAVEGLRRALAMKPDEPRLLNDLAASLLAAAEATGDLRYALGAVDAAQSAVRAHPSPPALFNAALSLERMGLRSRAAASWRQYLEQDPRSGWAQEAANRLDRLEHEAPEGRIEAELFARPEFELGALGRNPWADRQFGERLLARWGERTLAGEKSGAEAALTMAEMVASTLTAGGGRLLAASAAAIREAERARDGARLGQLARGHEAFEKGFWLRRSEHSAAAYRLLSTAVADLHSAATPFELRARLLRAASSPEPDWAEIQFVENKGREGGFVSLVAEGRLQAAYRMSLEGRLQASLDAYAEAEGQFSALGEQELEAVTAARRAELFDAVGNEVSALGELSRALAGAPMAADPWNRYSIYVVAAGATTGGFRRSAVELRREAADICREMPERPLCAIDSLLWVARLTPDAEVAGDALTRAEPFLAVVANSDGKERTAIDLTAARAQWLGGETRSRDEQGEASDLFADAAERYQAHGLAPSAARARAERARILERLGRSAEAAAGFRDALRTFRLWDQTDRFSAEGVEKRLPPELRSVYERLLNLELTSAGNVPSRGAFLLAEEMHDRLAPRRATHFKAARDADLNRWIAAVPAGTAIVAYALVGGQATAWIVEGGRFDQVTLAPRAWLDKRIRATAEIRDLDTWKRHTGALFEELLTPVMARLAAGTDRLVVIPDADLYDLPFRALWDAASGRYFDEELTVALAPSVSRALIPPEHKPPVSPRHLLAELSMGFTRFASDLGLRPLKRAGEEADAVRAIYGGRPEACTANDWQSFRRCAPRSGVIHLATHAAADSTPTGTWLAFPSETVTLGRLWQELPDLPAHPLVVLSSCQSAATAGGGEGLGGLARPFLARGARAVVGTLWKIEDDDASSLFPAFHRAYRQSGDAALALRESREILPQWRDRPWVWGAEVAISGIKEN
jgi:tetratricopeptide (TPR) repeat protein